MKLTDLAPQFIRYEERDGEIHFLYIDRIEQAQGIKFLCPKCFAENNGPIGTHAVICWSSSRGVPDHARPGPGRWHLDGSSYSDLSLMEEPGKTRSIQLSGGCSWHGFVTAGEVT
jgi:hypothetical protein